MPRVEREFFDPVVDEAAWEPVAGDRTGQLGEVVLSVDPETGDRTTLMRFPPGADTRPNGVLVHERWEEVWIVSGSLFDCELGETFTAGMYACRPPGMRHGPWTSEGGAVTFQVHHG